MIEIDVLKEVFLCARDIPTGLYLGVDVDRVTPVKPEGVCRGTSARVTMDHFRHLALQDFQGYGASTNILSTQFQRRHVKLKGGWRCPNKAANAPAMADLASL